MTILSTADWKTSGGIDAAVAALRNLGAEIDETLIKDLYALSKAVKKVNIDSIRTRLESLAKIMDELEKKVESGEKTFTTEQRN
jgi:predicted nucleotide-binding protein (sugar kinase/HSP70/actin superfamily)